MYPPLQRRTLPLNLLEMMLQQLDLYIPSPYGLRKCRLAILKLTLEHLSTLRHAHRYQQSFGVELLFLGNNVEVHNSGSFFFESVPSVHFVDVLINLTIFFL